MQVLAETDSWFCVSKPPCCSQEALIKELKHERPGVKFSAIYRLDDTVSGPILFAKTLEACHILRNAYGSDAITFTFEAVGWFPKPGPKVWTCDLSIAWDSVKQRAYPSKSLGKKCCTQFILNENYPHYGFVSCITHYLRPQQIQLHAHFSHFDIVGDTLWAPEPHWIYPPTHWKSTNADVPFYKHLHLVCSELQFPFLGESFTLQQPMPGAWLSMKRAIKRSRLREES